MRLHQTKKLLHNEGNQQNEKVNHWMEKIFANHISSKKLISQIYREAIQLNNNNKTWLKNEQRIWIDIFPKQTHRWPTNIWKDDQHHELLGKHKSKPQWHIILHLLQWLLSKRQRLTNVGKGCGRGNPHILLVGLQIGTVTMQNSMESPQKIKNRTIIWPSYSTSGYLSEENENTSWKRYMHTYVHCSIIYDS